MQKTLSIIKPDATRRNISGKINAKIEESLCIIQQKILHLSAKQAEGFYEIHRERPFFQELISVMISGRIIVQVLEGKDAIEKYRNLMGATNPRDALPGTIRAEFALSIGENSVHGSDSKENAEREISFFFPKYLFL